MNISSCGIFHLNAANSINFRLGSVSDSAGGVHSLRSLGPLSLIFMEWDEKEKGGEWKGKGKWGGE